MNPSERCRPYEGCKGTGTQHDLSNGVGECYCDCLTGQALRHADRHALLGATLGHDARERWIAAWGAGTDPHRYLADLMDAQPDAYAAVMRSDTLARRAEQRRLLPLPTRLPRDCSGCGDAACPSRAACLRQRFAPADTEGRVMADFTHDPATGRCPHFIEAAQ